MIVGGYSIASLRYKGSTHRISQRFEYNTLYNTIDCGFGLTPTDAWSKKHFPDDPPHISFNNNIVYDATTRYTGEQSVVVVGIYMSDELYNLAVPELEFNNNCYFNPNMPVQFSFGSGYNEKPEYSLGGTFSLAQWQAEYGYDTDSIEADPLFIAPEQDDFRLKAGSPCTGMGLHGSEVNQQQSSSGRTQAGAKSAASQANRTHEIQAGPNVYHFDPVNGNDDSDGSLDLPWRTFKNITTYYRDEYRPDGWVKLQPGDCVYLMDGVFSEILHSGGDTDPKGGESFIINLQSTYGTADKPIRLKAYPGHHPIMNPKRPGYGHKIAGFEFLGDIRDRDCRCLSGWYGILRG